VRFAGIDVGLKKSPMAVIEGKNAEILDDYKLGLDRNIHAVGIDAPLSFPLKGSFRECERKIISLGIKLFPSGSPFFRNVVLKGIEIAEEFKSLGVSVFEVYPYASRVILNIAPDCNKKRRECLDKIREELKNYVRVEIKDDDCADAVISAITVKLFYEGRGQIVSGKDGAILIPK